MKVLRINSSARLDDEVWQRCPSGWIDAPVWCSYVLGTMLTPSVSQISAGTAHPIKPKLKRV
jgi:hypothetical protein